MLSWNDNTLEKELTPKKMKKFLRKLNKLYKRYNVSIGHEDFQGGFIIEDYTEHNVKWMNAASFDFKEDKDVNSRRKH